MMRLSICCLLGASFLAVQAHVVRQQALRHEHQLVAQHAASGGELPATRLGGGTTRALGAAQDVVAQASAIAGAGPDLASLVEADRLAPQGDAPAVRPGTAGPILRI